MIITLNIQSAFISRTLSSHQQNVIIQALTQLTSKQRVSSGGSRFMILNGQHGLFEFRISIKARVFLVIAHDQGTPYFHIEAFYEQHPCQNDYKKIIEQAKTWRAKTSHDLKHHYDCVHLCDEPNTSILLFSEQTSPLDYHVADAGQQHILRSTAHYESILVIPDGVTSIGYATFYGCSSLEKVVIPRSVTRLNDKAFAKCTQLRSIIAPKHLHQQLDNYPWIYIETFQEYIQHWQEWSQNREEYGHFHFPTGITCINADTEFTHVDQLEFIQIPKDVATIGARVFTSFKRLRTIIIPESVIHLSETAFEHCDQLRLIIAPEHLREQLNRNYPCICVKTLQQCGECSATNDNAFATPCP